MINDTYNAYYNTPDIICVRARVRPYVRIYMYIYIYTFTDLWRFYDAVIE